MIIETERLILRPFNQSDLHDFYEYVSVEGVGEINSLSTDKIVNGTKEFVLHGGNASGSGAAEY